MHQTMNHNFSCLQFCYCCLNWSGSWEVSLKSIEEAQGPCFDLGRLCSSPLDKCRESWNTASELRGIIKLISADAIIVQIVLLCCVAQVSLRDQNKAIRKAAGYVKKTFDITCNTFIVFSPITFKRWFLNFNSSLENLVISWKCIHMSNKSHENNSIYSPAVWTSLLELKTKTWENAEKATYQPLASWPYKKTALSSTLWNPI